MSMTIYTMHHLVKENDLNHHSTLFAGQGASWMVEAGYIAASAFARTIHIVCLKIHGMTFTKPVGAGTLLRMEARVVHAGETSLTSYIKAVNAFTGEYIVDGYMTFIHTNDQGQPLRHELYVVAATEEEKHLKAEAEKLVAMR